ncbi:MAG: hypothetical protein GX051_03515 [Clostridiales bacterium]|nr:hypothetical protein [Clostridiales bacterium]
MKAKSVHKKSKNRLLSPLLCICLLIPFATLAFSGVVEPGLGDVDGNGYIEAADARIALRCATGLDTLTPEQLERADVDRVGGVTAADARTILRVATKLQKIEDSLPLDSLTQLTPDTYNGVEGTSSYCLVTSDYAECIAVSNARPVEDPCNPLYTPLPKGTYDYVVGGPYDDLDGDQFYELRSGRMIDTDDVQFVENGYNMPSNTVKAVRCVSGIRTLVTLSSEWRVPINVTLAPQAYYTGYQDRTFNVSEQTATYIDFEFFYTSSGEGTIPINQSGIVSRAEWISAGTSTILRFHLKQAGVFYGYVMNYDEKGYLCIEFKEKPQSLQNTVIMLDAGHGGSGDPGTAAKGIAEKTVNLQLVKKIQALLVAEGATVILTRDSDVLLTIAERRQLSYKYSPDLFLSIHCDGSTSTSSNGTRSFYYKCFSRDYADALHDSLYSMYTNELGRTITNRPSAFYVFAVTRTEACPAVLLETGFLTNTAGTVNDFNTLTSESGQNSVAAAVVRGIKNYYGF